MTGSSYQSRAVQAALIIGALVTACTDTAGPNAGPRWASLTAGVQFTCGLTAAGAAYCWGEAGSGQLGDGSTDSALGYQRLTPVPVTSGLTFVSLTTGGAHTCGLTSAGGGYCWGNDSYGQLGDAATVGDPFIIRLAPVAVLGGLTFSSLTAGGGHTCGLTRAGIAYCWGRNNYGQVGDSSGVVRTTPVAVAGGLTFAALEAGFEHTCGVTSSGAAYCWGADEWGELGNGQAVGICYQYMAAPDYPCSHVPVAVAGGLTFASLTAGAAYSCGLTPSGTAYCWGAGAGGTPVAVTGGLLFSRLTAGGGYACGTTRTGTPYCWGNNAEGELGNGSTSPSTTPVAVAGGLTFTGLTASWTHTCGVTPSGAAYCWGQNVFGALGDGSTTDRQTPVAVARPPT